jgi:6-phosphogluconate dehydrogenase
MADKGFKVCAYNRTTSKVDHFLENEAKGELEHMHLIRSTCADMLINAL